MFPAAAAAGSTVAVTLDSLSLVCPHWAGLHRSQHDPGLLTQIYTQILMLCSSAGEREPAEACSLQAGSGLDSVTRRCRLTLVHCHTQQRAETETHHTRSQSFITCCSASFGVFKYILSHIYICLFTLKMFNFNFSPHRFSSPFIFLSLPSHQFCRYRLDLTCLILSSSKIYFTKYVLECVTVLTPRTK